MGHELQASKEAMTKAPKAKKPRSFYEKALTEAERVRLPRAMEVEGLDEEIALLRVKLVSLLETHPEDMDMLIKCVNLLVRGVAIKYRLSPQSAETLSQKIMAVIKELGGALIPEESHEAG